MIDEAIEKIILSAGFISLEDMKKRLYIELNNPSDVEEGLVNYQEFIRGYEDHCNDVRFTN